MKPTDEKKDIKPLVSIIVPVYNVEAYLSRCVESILRQTHENLELLLINDGSTDQSGAICDDYALKDKRVNVIHQKNAGVSAARNAGLDNAKGEWIGFVDADDWVKSEMFEKLLKAAIYNEKLLACCNYIRYYSDEKQTFKIYSNTEKVVMREQMLELCIGIEHSHFFGRNIQFIYHHTVLDGTIENCPIRFDVSIHFCEDVLFLVQALVLVDSVAYIPDLLYYYFQREGSAINSINEKNLTALVANKQILKLVEKFSSRLFLLAAQKYAHNLRGIIGRLCNDKQYEKVSGLRREARRYANVYLFGSGPKTRQKIDYLATIFLPKYIVGLLSRMSWRQIGRTLKSSKT